MQDIGPPSGVSERRSQLDRRAWNFNSAGQLCRKERRQGERRSINLGPPPGVEERRYFPDPRNLISPLP